MFLGMSFKITWKDSNVIISFTKNLSYKDMYDVNNLVYGDSRFNNMKYQIADFSKIEKFEFTKEEITIISTLEKSSTIWNNKIKLAIITSDVDYLRAIKPYLEVMKTTNWELKVFKTIDVGEKWCVE